MDEPELIRRAARGDEAAWEPLIAAHQQAVFRLAYLFLGDPDEAQDIAQDTFLRAWRSLPRFEAGRPLRPWLLSIAANLARNRLRSAGRYMAALVRAFRAEPDPPPATEDRSAGQMRSQQLWQAVRRLDAPDQQIVYMRYFLDLSVVETAQAMRVPQGTVKSRLNRALGRLRNLIGQEFPMLDERQP